MGGYFSSSLQHHDENCEFCKHWEYGTYYTPGGICDPCKEFKVTHGRWVSRHKREWADGSGGRHPYTCLCCDVHKWFEENPSSYVHDISDATWRPVWDNLLLKLDTEKHNSASATVEQSPTSRDDAEFKKAMKNGDAKMACGRVMMLGEARVGERLLQKDVLNLINATTDQSACPLRRVLQNGTLRTITEQEEMKELTLSACKFMIDNPGSLLNTISSSNLKVIKAFYDPSTPDTEVQSAEDKISDSVKKLVTKILMERNQFGQNDRPKTSVLLHASIFPSEDTWDLLPLFLTPRTLSFLVFDAMGKKVDQFDESDREKYCKIIVLIYSSLQKKAEALHKKLTGKEGDAPYPRATILGMDNGMLSTADKSTIIENLTAKGHELPDTKRNDIKMSIVNLSSDDEILELKSQVQKFVVQLEIPTPIAWELFRKIFSYATMKFDFIQIEKVATIALLCGITMSQFPSVLNFYHQHGAFIYFSEVAHLNKIVIVNPDWLYKNLRCLMPIYSYLTESQKRNPNWKHLQTHGILVPSLQQIMWPSSIEFTDLAAGMIDLMNKYHLAVEITVPRSISDEHGPKFFVPYVLKSCKSPILPAVVGGILSTATLHFIFEGTKYLPPGVFVRLATALVVKTNSTESNFSIDLDGNDVKVYCDRISYRYKELDCVTISTTATSLCVQIHRLKNCDTTKYDTMNFGSTCQDIFMQVKYKLVAVLEELYPSIEEPATAFLCGCTQDESSHYVIIKTDTEYDKSPVVCKKHGIHHYSNTEQFWFKVNISSSMQENLNDNEIRALIDILGSNDIETLMQALEINITGKDYFTTLKRWSNSINRKYFIYHLWRLNPRQLWRETAEKIIIGAYKEYQQPAINLGER